MKASPTVVILRPDHIGDLILTTPMIRALAVAGWKVDVIAPPIVSLLQGNPHVRRLESLMDISPRWPRDWPRLARYLRKQRYDALIIPYAHPRALLLASLFSGARKRIAMWGGILGRLTGHHCVRSAYFEQPRPYAETILRALQPLDIPPQGIEPELSLTPSETEMAGGILAERLSGKIRIGIHPFCLGNTCNLPLSVYRDVARLILEKTDWSVIVTGSSADRPHVESWQQLSPPASRRLWVACGDLDLRRLAAIYQQLDLLIVPSTGPLHMARAVGTLTLSPFCPQMPVCAGIWGHAPLHETSIEPSPAPCDPSTLHAQHCDFRKQLGATDIFERLCQSLCSSVHVFRGANNI